jgi:hypothetical protein
MDDSQLNPSNVLLVLMCLDRNDTNPLRLRNGQLDKNGAYHLLAGVLDPAHRAASAPVTGIELNGDMLDIYNKVLSKFQEISEKFYCKGGFIENPDSYTDEKQTEVFNDMSAVGKLIYELFPIENPVRGWLDKLLRSKDVRPIQPVTIITNDFNIPWFWLKGPSFGPFLCEVCSLGLLQLLAAGDAEGHRAPPGRADKKYEALLINESASLPFLNETLDGIATLLEAPHRWAARDFKVHRANNSHDIAVLTENSREYHLLSSFRIVHFSGHYSSQTLHIFNLKPILNSSLLVLDGGALGPKGNTNVEGLASGVMSKGALGCVLSVLPVKHDPIASKVLWETFYGELRRPASTVGQALAKARVELRDHFKAIGSPNPMYATYQLIGSPAIHLCHEGNERDG